MPQHTIARNTHNNALSLCRTRPSQACLLVERPLAVPGKRDARHLHLFGQDKQVRYHNKQRTHGKMASNVTTTRLCQQASVLELVKAAVSPLWLGFVLHCPRRSTNATLP